MLERKIGNDLHLEFQFPREAGCAPLTKLCACFTAIIDEYELY